LKTVDTLAGDTMFHQVGSARSVHVVYMAQKIASWSTVEHSLHQSPV